MKNIKLTEINGTEMSTYVNSDYTVRWYPELYTDRTIVVMSVGDSLEVIETPSEIASLISQE